MRPGPDTVMPGSSRSTEDSSSARRLPGQLGWWDWDVEADSVRWSEEFERLHGLPPGDIPPSLESYGMIVHPGDHDGLFAELRRWVCDGVSTRNRYRVILPDGRVRWLEVRAAVLRTDGCTRVTGVCCDVTDERRAEQWRGLYSDASTVLSSLVDVRTSVQSVADLLVPDLADGCCFDVLDDERVCRIAASHVRPDAARMLAQVPAQHPIGIEDPAGVGGVLRSGEFELYSEIEQHALARIATTQGHREFLRDLAIRSALFVPLRCRGKVLGVLTLFHSEPGRNYVDADVDFAQELGRRVATAIDNAQLYENTTNALRMRDEFLATISHDLRTPLSTISLAASSIDHTTDIDPTLRRRMLLIGRACAQASHLIHDLLDVAQIERGALRLRPELLDMVDVIKEAAALVGQQAELRGVRIEEDITTVPRVRADRIRLVQVLCNLLGNALRFTPRGGAVRVSVRSKPPEIIVSVADDGPGLPPEQVHNVFRPFWQGGDGANTGAGLGLSIVKGIVEAHGGRVWADCRPRSGAIFRFALECQNTPSQGD